MGGDGSGSIVSLIGTLVGSSSGGGAEGGARASEVSPGPEPEASSGVACPRNSRNFPIFQASEDGEEGGGGGSDLQAVLKTVLPIIGSLSGIASSPGSCFDAQTEGPT